MLAQGKLVCICGSLATLSPTIISRPLGLNSNLVPAKCPSWTGKSSSGYVALIQDAECVVLTFFQLIAPCLGYFRSAIVPEMISRLTDFYVCRTRPLLWANKIVFQACSRNRVSVLVIPFSLVFICTLPTFLLSMKIRRYRQKLLRPCWVSLARSNRPLCPS